MLHQILHLNTPLLLKNCYSKRDSDNIIAHECSGDTTMPPTITIGFSSHRIEVIPFARKLMNTHDVIIIEEAPNPKFIDMLKGTIAIDEYLGERDAEGRSHCKGPPERQNGLCGSRLYTI